jgi:hypothetical protein
MAKEGGGKVVILGTFVLTRRRRYCEAMASLLSWSNWLSRAKSLDCSPGSTDDLLNLGFFKVGERCW